MLLDYFEIRIGLMRARIVINDGVVSNHYFNECSAHLLIILGLLFEASIIAGNNLFFVFGIRPTKVPRFPSPGFEKSYPTPALTKLRPLANREI